MKLKFALFLALQLLNPLAQAAQAAASPSAPPPVSTSQPVFVVAPADLPKQNQGVAIDTPKQAAPETGASKPAVPIQVWSGPVRLAGGLWLLVASMPVLAILFFAYQLWLFIRARRRRLTHEKN